ncbi:MAG: GAF domain-containing protein [Ardenticatenaceae bacterium]|nr:GAF domain-containing protein [Ardenticatenaceae bacterium]
MLQTQSPFYTLKSLPALLKQADSFSELEELTASFLQELLSPETVEIFYTIEHLKPAVAPALVLQLPIGRTNYYLRLERPDPFEGDEMGLVEVVAGFLATSPHIPAHGEPLPGQLKLVQAVNQAIVDQRRFVEVVEVVALGFAAAFPGVRGRLLAVNGKARKLMVQAVFGGVTTAVDKMSLPIDEGLAALIGGGETAVLAHEVLVPIKIENVMEAVLQGIYPEGALIDAGDVTAFTLLAGALAISLSNRKLMKQTWQRANELETIYKVTESARELKPLGPTLAEIHQKLLTTFEAPTSFIALYEPELQLISFPFAVNNGQPVAMAGVSIADENSLAAWVITHNQPYVTDDWAADNRPVMGLVHFEAPTSVICVPMRADGQVLGAISIQSDAKHAFDASDFQLLTAVANHVGVIVQNARRFTTTKEMVDKGTQDYMTAVALRQAITTISTSQLEQTAVLHNFLMAIGNIVDCDNAFVLLNEFGELHFAASREFKGDPPAFTGDDVEAGWHGSLLLQEIQDKKKPLYLPDVTQDERWRPFAGGEQIRSWLGVPLLIRDEVLGALMLHSHEVNHFGEQQEWLVVTLANHAAVTMQNARLHQRTEQRLAELGTLYEASATMTADLDQDAVLQAVVTEMVRAIRVDSCTILVWDQEQETLYPAAHENLLYMEDDPGEAAMGLSTVDQLEQHPVVRRIFSSQEIYHLNRAATQDVDELALLDAVQFDSLLFVPLTQRQQVLGLLALGQISQRPYSERQMRLARNLASQAAVAIEHAHLFGQAQRRINELSTFHEIVLKLNTPLNVRSVLDAIAESALKLIPASNLHIYMYDMKTQQFTTGAALWSDGRREPAVTSLRREGLTATVVRHAEPIIINDASKHHLFQSEKAQAWGIHAIAGFPLKQGDEVIGAFTITYLYTHKFTDDEILLLHLFADQSAVAVKNARLFAQIERRARDTEALVDMAKQVTRNLKLTSVLDTAVQIIQRLLNARASTITMLSEDGTELILAAATGVKKQYMSELRMKLNDTISGEVVKQGQMIYIPDTYDHTGFLFFDKVVRSLLVFPLIARNEAIGTLTVDSDRPEAFTESDIQLMTVAAAQVGIAIANARLFEELERHTAELSRAYEELKESDRLKDELVQNVSHELRTPLTFVKGYVDLLMDGEMGVMTPEQVEALKIVSEKTDVITRLIQDIMALQRIDSGNLQMEEVAMADLIETAVAGHRLVASDKGIEVAHNLTGEKGIVVIDRGRINQVLDNLIGNAVKFSPDGGTIMVSLEERESEVCVTVSDEGIGLAEDQRERIFDRFYQVDGSAIRRFGGTGLGLAIVKRIVDAHHGRVWVESELNKGSTFYFTLPKARFESAPVV